MTVKRLITRGIIKGRQVVPHAPWVINKSDLDTDKVKTAVSDAKRGKRTIRQENPDQESLELAVQ